jgi:mannan endo-1,4-beta-mannosidase
MGKVLKIRGSKLFAPNGTRIILTGVNKMFIFEQDINKRVGLNIYPEIAKTGANCVRIVWGMDRKDANGNVVRSSVQELDAVIANCKANKMIPIIGLWDFTGDLPDSGFSKLSKYVDFWCRPDVVAVLKKHEDALIINIANEASEECDDSENELNAKLPAFVNSFSIAVKRIRDAGILSPLMIDGLDFGKSLKCFSFVRRGLGINVATELLNADTQKNLIFSFHSYWPKRFTDGQTFVEEIFNQAVTDGFCFVIGELSKYGAEGKCEEGEVDYKRFAKLCTNNMVGYMLWEWGPGNELGDSSCGAMNMTTNGTFSRLRDWGKEMVESQDFGFKVKGRLTNVKKMFV